MNRTTFVPALALALLAMAWTAAADPSTNEPTVIDETTHDHISPIEPADVLAAIQAKEPFGFPTTDGQTVVVAGDPVQPAIHYASSLSTGGAVDVVRPPNVWAVEAADGSAQGVVLAFNRTFRGWLLDDAGVTLVEPTSQASTHPLALQDYRVYRILDAFGGGGPDGSGADGHIGVLSHIAMTKSVYAYVDTQYRDQYGSCCWADQITYVLSLLNWYFDDVQLEYRFAGGEVDTGFASNDLDTAWTRLVGRSYHGAAVKSYWSYRDFDGCEVGTAALPGSMFVIQHAPDACHLDLRPSTDAERAYLTAHELGKNNDAHPDYGWSDTTLTGHTHRSIMRETVWWHYHGCWSQVNLNRMSSFLGTSPIGAAC